MKKNYAHLDIEFFPERILKDLSQHQQLSKPLADNFNHISDLSSNLICNFSLDSDSIFSIFIDCSQYS